MKSSTRETAFRTAWAISGNGVVAREQFQFDIKRRWRFDFAWPAYQVAVEIHGGEMIRGGHNRGRGMQKDLEKLRAAIVSGWLVLPFVGVDLDERPVQCCHEITRALQIRGCR